MSFLSKWKDKIAQYLDVHIRLWKLEFIEHTSHVLGYMLFVIAMLSLALIVLVFAGFGIAETMSYFFGSRIAGYFSAAGIYFILMLVTLALRKKITAIFGGLIVRLLTHKDNENEEEEEPSTE